MVQPQINTTTSSSTDPDDQSAVDSVNPKPVTTTTWWPWVVVSAVVLFVVVLVIIIFVCVRKYRHRSLKRKGSTEITENKLYSVTGVTGNIPVNVTIYTNEGYIPDVIPTADRQVASRNYKYDYVRTINTSLLMSDEQKIQHLKSSQEIYVNTLDITGTHDLDDDSKQYQNIFSEKTEEEYTDVVSELKHCQMHHSYVEMSDEIDMGLYNKLNHGTRSVRRTELEDITYSHIQPESEGEYTILCGGEAMVSLKIYENQPDKWSNQP
ncbi:uncharacterized protein LOC134230876 [Saccostrea cucullata]|uniref:uncharacterized protein LOC134230876 n=1 Tax=Saccostrea cuccullata TaxID=36930 RepID=UPI002ED34FD9